MRRFLVVAALVLAVAPAAYSQDKFDPDAHARAVAPFLDDRVIAVGHIDLARIDLDKVITAVAQGANAKPQDVAAQIKEPTARWLALQKAGARHVYFVVSLADAPESEPLVVWALDKGGDANKLAAALQEGAGVPKEVIAVEPRHNAVLVVSTLTRKRLATLKPTARPEIAKAFTHAGDGIAQLVVVPTPDTRKILEDTLPTLPPELGGGPIKPLSRGFQWATVTLDPAPKLDVRATVQAADKESAEGLAKLLEKALAVVATSEDLRREAPAVEKLARLVQPKVANDRLSVTISGKEFISVMAPSVLQVRDATERNLMTNNLKQIGIAMHSYHDANRALPAAYSVDKNGKPLLSWRVHILPYIEQEKLYKEFKLDEPWDSDHNKKLIEKMPKVFATGSDPKLAQAGKTTFVVPFGKDLIFNDSGKGRTLATITDGTSNTVMALHADDEAAVVWTKPEDLPLTAKEPLKKLGKRYDKGFLVLMADGSVRMVSNKVDPALFWKMLTPAGGEVIEP